MAEWKKVRLGDIFNLQMGKTPNRKKLDYFQGSHKWISIADISKSEKYILETKERLTDEAITSSRIKSIPKDTVIMSFKLSIGKTAITSDEMYSNEAIMAFLPNGKYETDNSFLYHLFSNKDWSEGSNKAVKGITLNKASLTETKIFLPPIKIQKQIATTLDKVYKIITENKQLLEKYNLLIKSRFIEMFGDPIQNSMEWEVCNIGNFIKYANNGMSRRGNDKHGNIVLRLVELQRGFINFSECNRIEIKSNEEKFLLKNNDFLFARVNGNPDNVGRCCYFKDIGEPVYHNDHIIRVHFDENRLNEYYLNTALNSEYGKSEFKKYIKTSAGQYTIAQDGISSVQIYVPPLALQQRFAQFVQQIDKSKFIVEKSLEKAETLYKSLIQEYFG